MSAFKPITNHVIPFEQTISFNEDLALGELTAGSGKSINLLTLNGIRLEDAEFRINNLTGTSTGLEYAVKLFTKGKIAGATDVIATSAAKSTSTTTTVTGCLSIDNQARKYDSVVVGIEITGGTTGRAVTIAGEVSIKGTSRGSSFSMPAGGDASFCQPGSSLAFNATTTDYTVTASALAAVL